MSRSPITPSPRPPGVTFVGMDQLLAESDFLSLHLPATKESRHLINRQSLAKMEADLAYVINTARGAVNEADLIERCSKEDRWGGH